MDYWMLVLRLVHIFAGVFWVGTTLTTGLYLRPATQAAGEGGRQVMHQLITKARLATAMTTAAILTVLAGYAMYWLDSDGFTSAWTHSGPGTGFAIGGGAGLLGLITRILANRNMGALNRLASGSDESSTKEESQKLNSLQKTQALLYTLNTWLLIIAVLFMATARYLVF